ncbi:MAG: hypothetical protein PF508_08070 [Spirochaeta sp.]|jgi:hypothetical protein|nr:hypothetical protein [Spirochaeta sp.]
MAKINICLLCYEISGQFSSVRTYLEEVEKSWPNVERRLRGESEQRLEDLGVTADEHEFRIESQILERIIEVDLPQQAGYAGAILVFTAVEASFKRLVAHLIKDRRAKLELTAFAGSLLEKIDRFLLVHELPALTDGEKSRLTDFSRIRNCIVHAAGDTRNEGTKTLNNIERSEGLSIDMDFLVVEYSYVTEQLSRFEELFKRLLSALGYENRPLQETP